MMRFIAKLLIERSYDDASRNRRDPLPPWLRRWVKGDTQLQAFEQRLLRLENSLKSQSGAFLDGRATELPRSTTVPHQGNWATTNRTNVWPWLALAAMLTGVLAVGSRWLDWSADRAEKIRIAHDSPLNPQPSTLNEWVEQSTALSKGLAKKLDQTRSQANLALSNANKNATHEREQLLELGRDGLKFVAHKLPAATVRMLGMSAQQSP
ncbi:MAG: hypothetical protein ABL921_07510 [Pirellula sp.]